MRTLSVLMVAMALAFQTAILGAAETAGPQDHGIQWTTDFDAALARGQAQNKPVFIDFFNPN